MLCCQSSINKVWENIRIWHTFSYFNHQCRSCSRFTPNLTAWFLHIIHYHTRPQVIVRETEERLLLYMILHQHEKFHKYVYDTHGDNMQGMIALNTTYFKFQLMFNVSIHIFQVIYHSNSLIVILMDLITLTWHVSVYSSFLKQRWMY